MKHPRIRIFALSLLAAGLCPAARAADQELTLERSSDLQNWEKVTLDVSMLTPEGTLRVGAEPPVFYRMDIQPGVPEGFLRIPAGSFEMGDSIGDGWGRELPVHTVYLSAFYLQNTEVTKAQWDAIRTWATTSGLGYTDLPEGEGKGPTHPVHSVSWLDAVKWLNAWSEMDGLNPVYRVGGAVMRSGEVTPEINYAANGYRLPTEAEWEKAARGGLSGRRFPWGDTISHSQANYYSSSYYAYDISPTRGYHPTYGDGVMPYTSPVRSFAANGYGLYDMAGNLWEWCGDWYLDSYYNDSPTTDPTGPGTGSIRVSRGGSWYDYAQGCRCAFRYHSSPGVRHHSIGFRPARTAMR